MSARCKAAGDGADQMAPLPTTRRFVPISYRVDHAAELIGLSPSRVWELIGEGAIRAKKLGRATVILHDVLRAYVEGAPDWMPPRKVAR